jgi:hypothetical protein
VVSGVSKACLTQAEILAASKKRRKPPISGVYKLTKVLNSRMCFPLNGKGNSDSMATKINLRRTGFIWRKPAFLSSDEKFFERKTWVHRNI